MKTVSRLTGLFVPQNYHCGNTCETAVSCWQLDLWSSFLLDISTPVIINLSMIELCCSLLQIPERNGKWCQSISGELLIGKNSPWSDHKKKRNIKIIMKQEKNSKILEHSHLFITEGCSSTVLPMNALGHFFWLQPSGKVQGICHTGLLCLSCSWLGHYPWIRTEPFFTERH